MKRYSKIDIHRVGEKADIRDHIPELKGKGASLYRACPQCGKSGKGKGLVVTHKKDNHGQMMNVAKCFSCGYTVLGAIKARQEFHNEDFITAFETCAQMAGIYNLTPEDDNRDQKSYSFLEIQLAQSGLTLDDVAVKVPIKGTNDYSIEAAFRSGGVDSNWNVIPGHDELLIYYYDLDGNLRTFTGKAPMKRTLPYIRVRWSNPNFHIGRDGKPFKYQTPTGAPSAFYIPQIIRDYYREGRTIETLFIQEGEKKAEKACKHGMLSLGIQGIYNIGKAETGIFQELQYIVRKCSTKNVVLIMDSDWDHLSKNLQSSDHIDARPNQFSRAVIKFNDYTKSLHSLGLSVNTWWGHVRENKKGDKGIDDLLVNTLKGYEEKLIADIDLAMHAHNGEGEYLNIHKITTLSDMKIRDFWLLNSREKFFEKYHDQIKDLSVFRFGRITYVNDDGTFKEAVRNATDSPFWSVEVSEKGKKSVKQDTVGLLDFLQANSFSRIHGLQHKPGEYSFIKIEDFVVSETSGAEMRQFVYDYVIQNSKDRDIHNAFAYSLGSWLGSDKLERLKIIEDNFYNPLPEQQKFYYSNCCVKITPEGIVEGPNIEFVWHYQRIKRPFRRVPLLNITKKNGKFEVAYYPEAEKCEFLKYLENSSNFWKGSEAAMSDDDYNEFWQYLTNKITAIGFLLCNWKPRSEQVAIVAMDSKMDEVGVSNGRSGKSLLGLAVKQMEMVTTVDAKNLNGIDEFIYSLVTDKTRMLFIDDVQVSFDFGVFYQALTGDLQVNPKGGARFEIPFKFSPKIYITTNHALYDTTASGEDRRAMVAFSNYYSKKFTPYMEFGHNFFDDWDDEQWILFDNLMVECVYWYLVAYINGWERPGRGVVQPPMDNLSRRQNRQIMGETFLLWADSYFDPGMAYINSRLVRTELSNEFHKEFEASRDRISAQHFAEKMRAFCRYKGYHFNPMCKNDDGQTFSQWRAEGGTGSFIGRSQKSNSKEYWMVATDEYAKNQPW